ncbi:MAG: hypothetical protein ACE5KZ_06965 [Candidatus Scalinduaceae bacterium]
MCLHRKSDRAFRDNVIIVILQDGESKCKFSYVLIIGMDGVNVRFEWKAVRKTDATWNE